MCFIATRFDAGRKAGETSEFRLVEDGDYERCADG
jgi:hypothetical protein